MGLFDKIKKTDAKVPASKITLPPPPVFKGVSAPVNPSSQDGVQPLNLVPPSQQTPAPVPPNLPQTPISQTPQQPAQGATQHPIPPNQPQTPQQSAPKQLDPLPLTHPVLTPAPKLAGFEPPSRPATYAEQHIKFHQPVPHIPTAPHKEDVVKSVPTSVPQELPAFPVKAHVQEAPMQREEIAVPAPPPNLRSEITPLELEKLEEKYLGRAPKISAMDAGERYDRHQNIKKPLFVRTDNYRQMLNAFIEIKDDLKQEEEVIYRLENLKKNADIEFDAYKKATEDIQRKLIYIDKSIFES